MSKLTINSVLIVGLGMIGGSIACGLRRTNPSLRITAVDRDTEQLALAHKDGVIDAYAVDLAELVSEAELIIVAVPTLAIGKVLEQIGTLVNPSAVITDVASVKSEVMSAARMALGKAVSRFVPGHPIAGSEKSGYPAASAELFSNRKVILTPEPETDCDAVNRVNWLWRQLGADVLGMNIARHDEVLAATSHLPHLLSYALVDVLLKQQQSEDIFRYAAGGFADFSRLASSDPTMWADIFVTNSTATLAVLDQFIEYLQQMRQLLVQQDHASLKYRFTRAKQARDRFIGKFYQAMKSEQQENPAQLNYVVLPGGQVRGDVRVPGDKSISHRAVIFGSIATGVTQVSGFLEGEDALNTLETFRELGVTIVGPDQGRLTIFGVGRDGLQPPRKPLYMGNSGTAMRLLCGLLAAQDFSSELTGDESLSGRPMRRITDPLAKMGAYIETSDNGTPPLKIFGKQLQGIEYKMPMASAQVQSCLLLAGLYANGTQSVTEPAPCRDHTERMLSGFGYPVRRDGNTVSLKGGHDLVATSIDVPADISSAAFFLVAAAITP
ncbi:MAG: prephenate dehydrogenase/arogenate dehydrogenase family protein, partial [Pseudohongiellaceae bacterium]